MLDKITKLVRDYSGDAIINNPSVPNEKNDEAINTTAASLVDHLKGEAASGNASTVMDIFKGDSDATSNPAVSKISKGVAGDLMTKLGIDNSAATGIVNKIIPNVLNKVKNKSNDPNDKEWDFKDILGSLGIGSVGEQGGMMDSVKNIFGKKD